MDSNMVVYLLYCALYFVCTTFQRFVWWQLNGVESKLKQRQTDNFENCAHVMKVVARCYNRLNFGASRRHFLTTHSNFDSPFCVLADNVSLYAINAKEAVFVQTPPDISVYNSNINPFLNLAQFAHAEKIIILPIIHFHRLAQEIGNPKVPVIFQANVGRCGSTLLTQMLETLPGVISINEPYAIHNIRDMEILGKISKDDVNQLVISMVRLQCKEMHKSVPSLLFVKPNPGCDCTEIISKELPSAKFVFLYRGNVLKQVQSFKKLLLSAIEFRLLNWLITSKFTRFLCPYLSKRVYNFFMMNTGQTLIFPIPSDSEHDLTLSEIFTLRCYRLCQKYVKTFSTCNVAGVRYEDLLHNTENACKALAKHCNLPSEFLSLAPQALKLDSQRGTYISKDKLKHYDQKLTSDETCKLQEKLKQFGVPTVSDEDWCLPNTITTPKGTRITFSVK